MITKQDKEEFIAKEIVEGNATNVVVYNVVDTDIYIKVVTYVIGGIVQHALRFYELQVINNKIYKNSFYYQGSMRSKRPGLYKKLKSMGFDADRY